MIKVQFRKVPVSSTHELVLSGDMRELRQILGELQTAKKYGYAKFVADTDISREIIRIDQEGMR